MQYNILGYWQSLQNLPAGHEDRPSPRVCRLLTDVLEHWRSKLPFIEQGFLCHLFDRYEGQELSDVRAMPVAKRKALSVVKTLERIVEPDLAQRAHTFSVQADELILGTMPPYSVGQGKELMLYLTEEEALRGQLKYLNEWSPFGHVIPDHERLVRRGLTDIIEEAKQRSAALPSDDPGQQKAAAFYEAVSIALEGVIGFAESYARAAEALAARQADEPERHQSLLAAAERLRRVPARPAESFIEAVQSIHLMHCALHFTGEIVSLGRLDQILYPFFQADFDRRNLTPEAAQEIIDCWWLKLDEPVMLHRKFFEDRFSSSDGALLGAEGPSNFDQGALANQWMQQCTLGGIKATNDAEPEDASNEVTYLCLRASRRLPLNSPTLDLRVHKDTPEELLREAARTQLSGGAHPILLNDDKLVPQLHEGTGGTVELRSARNYSCDGCYETIFPGETEFSFGYIPALDVLEKALNSGAGFGAAGGTYLRGVKSSWRTKPAAQIESFEDFWGVLDEHIAMKTHEFFAGVLAAYGEKEPYCPSVLLSPLIAGCLESGRDISGGGARYHMFAPLMTGISTAADSLYVIKQYVFEEGRFTLEELVSCLRVNWGDNPEVVGLRLSPERIAEIHRQCLAGPKFGTDNKAVDGLAYRLIETFHVAIHAVKGHPVHEAGWQALRQRYDQEGRPFEIILTPGVGTFEQYVFGGSFAGATADGRKSGGAIASDFSPAPLHGFEDPLVRSADGSVRHAWEIPVEALFKSYNHPSIELLSDGAPCDINIRENVPEEALTAALRRFAQGEAGNILTVTVANPETFAAADEDSGAYELVRVRMGGWTEFFSVLFPAHRAQHMRRPLIVLS
jgi:pyruvate-formate lyase